MIEVLETSDIEVIKKIITNEHIYPHISDDLSPDPDAFEPIIGDNLHWLLVRDGDRVGGLFFVHRINAAVYEVHTCLLKECRKGKAIDAANSCIDWVFNNTQSNILITHVPEYNIAAYKLAENVGFSFIGTIKGGWLKHGKYQDLHELGVTRCQQQQ